MAGPAAHSGKAGGLREACMRSEEDCGRWINQLAHQIKRRMDARLAGMGVTGVQGRVLHYIMDKCKEGPVFQRDVEQAFTLRRSTATGILQLLEKNGLIRRESVPSDARLKSLVPTEKAGGIHLGMRECIRETETLLTRGVDPDELRVFLQVAKQMSKNLGS